MPSVQVSQSRTDLWYGWDDNRLKVSMTLKDHGQVETGAVDGRTTMVHKD
jgi:hypothetical protein